MTHPYDPIAAKILFDTYWSSSGWKSNQGTSPEDLAYAKDKGVMFDSCLFDHDHTVGQAIKMAASIPRQNIAEAFLYSLTTRDLAYRSALGSFVMAYWMPVHSFTGNRRCEVCGSYPSSVTKDEDLNVLNFERLKWGGIRHTYPVYQLFDLNEFLKLPEVKAKDEDLIILHAILGAIATLPAKARVRDAEKVIAAHVKSSKSERDVMVQIFGYCGILQPRGRKGFFREYAECREREEKDVDWNYPVSWWRGADGINYEAVGHYFPSLSKVVDGDES